MTDPPLDPLFYYPGQAYQMDPMDDPSRATLAELTKYHTRKPITLSSLVEFKDIETDHFCIIGPSLPRQKHPRFGFRPTQCVAEFSQRGYLPPPHQRKRKKCSVLSLKHLAMGVLHLNLFQRWRPYASCPHLYCIDFRHQSCQVFSLDIPFTLKRELIAYSGNCERHYGKYDIILDETSFL